jgi:hypothetical protein
MVNSIPNNWVMELFTPMRSFNRDEWLGLFEEQTRNPQGYQIIYELSVQSRLLHPCFAQSSLTCTLRHVKLCVRQHLRGATFKLFYGAIEMYYSTLVNGVGMGESSLRGIAQN